MPAVLNDYVCQSKTRSVDAHNTLTLYHDLTLIEHIYRVGQKTGLFFESFIYADIE